MVTISVVVRVWSEAQEFPPAQPLGEAQVAQQFQEAAPGLFQQWLDRRAESREGLTLGHRNRPKGGFCPAITHFEFTECRGSKIPTLYKVDVTRTNSLLTPFLGHLYVQVWEDCLVRNVVGPKGTHWGKKGYEEAMTALEPNCLAKTYAECISAGGRNAPKVAGSACTGGPVRMLPSEGSLDLVYQWSQGKWEFFEEKISNGVTPTGNH
jgi:hypothetical protein